MTLQTGFPKEVDSSGAVPQAAANFDFYVRDYAGVLDGVADDTIPLNNTIAAATAAGGGNVKWGGILKTTSAIYLPRWVNLEGIGFKKPGGSYDGTSVLLGAHNGVAVLSLKGALGCRLSNFVVASPLGFAPKTGLCLGRSSASSAGTHIIRNVGVDGYFTKAAAYFIASEENVYDTLNIYLRGGGALHALYTGQGDDLAVDGMTGSSNVDHLFLNPRIQNDGNAGADAETCIYIEGGAGSGDFLFVGGYLIPSRGSYVKVRTGNEDGASMPRGTHFIKVSGEMGPASSGPLYGYDLGVVGALSIDGLDINGGVLPTRATGAAVRQAATLTLRDGRIKMPLPNNAASLVDANLLNMQIDFGHGNNQKFYGPAEHVGGRLIVDKATANGLQYGDQTRQRYQAATGDLETLNAAASAYADQRSGRWLRIRQIVAFAAAITPDASLGEIISVGALTGGITINAPTNPKDGQRLMFCFVQDGTGGRTVTWNAVFSRVTWSDAGNVLNTRSSIGFIYDSTAAAWQQVGAQRLWA